MTLYEKYKDEINWWEEVLVPGNRAEWMEDAIDPERRSKIFPPGLANFISELKLKRKPLVLDVGSGPLSPLAWGVDQKLIDVVAVDPIAEVYEGILKKFGIDYPVKPMHGHGEKVGELFEKGHFDVVFSRNAIDHSDSPAECITNMMAVLRKGGILYMSGFNNEATRNKWQGLHQWNIRKEGVNLICSGASGAEVELTKSLPLDCIYEYGPDEREWYRIAYRKTGLAGSIKLTLRRLMFSK